MTFVIWPETSSVQLLDRGKPESTMEINHGDKAGRVDWQSRLAEFKLAELTGRVQAGHRDKAGRV